MLLHSLQLAIEEIPVDVLQQVDDVVERLAPRLFWDQIEQLAVRVQGPRDCAV
jgi:hypothetical protein